MAFALGVTPTGQLRWVEGTRALWVTNYPVARDESFGQLLRRLREDAGYSQEIFAEKVGLSRKTVQTIENARGRPKIKNEVAVVTEMAKVLGVNTRELSHKLDWVPASEAERAFWDRGLDDEARTTIAHLADLLRVEPPERLATSPKRAARS